MDMSIERFLERVSYLGRFLSLAQRLLCGDFKPRRRVAVSHLGAIKRRSTFALLSGIVFMAIAKRNSRLITYLGSEYRFAVFGNSGWNDMTIQHAEGAGQKLVVQFPAIEKTSDATKNIITPGLVIEAIKAGLERDWNPLQNAQPMRLKFKDGNFQALI